MTVIRSLFEIIFGGIQLIWSIFVHIVFTAIVCFILSYTLKYGINYNISWWQLTLLYYGVYLVVRRFVTGLRE